MTHSAVSRTAVLLVSPSGLPIYVNRRALAILAYPGLPDSTGTLQNEPHLREMLSRLLGDSKDEDVVLRSGRRRYHCRAFSLSSVSEPDADQVTLVSLERVSQHSVNARRLVERFHLTRRETEAASLLVEGLTNKEIAAHMQIAPNTVKAFLKLVMLKMDVSTRAGVVGKVIRA